MNHKQAICTLCWNGIGLVTMETLTSQLHSVLFRRRKRGVKFIVECVSSVDRHVCSTNNCFHHCARLVMLCSSLDNHHHVCLRVCVFVFE